MFLGQVHGYLPHLCHGLFAAFGEHVLLLDIEVPAHLVEYEIYGYRFVFHFYRTFQDLFRQRQVYVAVPYDGVSHERVDDTFQFAYAVVHVFRNEVDDFFRYFQAVLPYFVFQNIMAKLLVRLLQFGQ